MVVGIVIAIGTVITLLSLFILMLSVSLIMEKNRDTIHRLLMLGYDLRSVGRPYATLVIWATGAAYVLAVGAVFLLRAYYLTPLEGLGAHPSTVWLMITVGAVLTLLIILANLLTVRRRVRSAFRL